MPSPSPQPQPLPPSDSADKFIVRMPPGMRETLAELAAKNGRSMNAEVVERLLESITFTEQQSMALSLAKAQHELLLKELTHESELRRVITALRDFMVELDESGLIYERKAEGVIDAGARFFEVAAPKERERDLIDDAIGATEKYISELKRLGRGAMPMGQAAKDETLRVFKSAHDAALADESMLEKVKKSQADKARQKSPGKASDDDGPEAQSPKPTTFADYNIIKRGLVEPNPNPTPNGPPTKKRAGSRKR